MSDDIESAQATLDAMTQHDASAAARLSVLEDLTDDVQSIIADLRRLQEEMTDDLDSAALAAVSDTSSSNVVRSSAALGIATAALVVSLFSVWLHFG